NVGWRIDYNISTSAIKDKVVPESDYVYKENCFSDHAPLTINYDYEV
ncbi:exodeoxyribonuclease III, partial [Francisella tularensis subsp. holarctica]|nr:exodeoxyribonuclease III [Francisella tularensis subsp. holarctica]